MYDPIDTEKYAPEAFRQRSLFFNNMQFTVPVEYAKQWTGNSKFHSFWRIPDKPEDYDLTARAICIQNIQQSIGAFHTRRMIKVMKEKYMCMK